MRLDIQLCLFQPDAVLLFENGRDFRFGNLAVIQQEPVCDRVALLQLRRQNLAPDIQTASKDPKNQVSFRSKPEVHSKSK